MWDTPTNHANDQMRRLNERIAEVAADYSRMRLQRKLSLQAGDIRRAKDLHKRLHALNSNLALLAGQRRQSESVQKLA
jgi:hypothetical protein